MSEKVGGGKHEVTYRGNKGIIASIPYAVTLRGLNFSVKRRSFVALLYTAGYGER